MEIFENVEMEVELLEQKDVITESGDIPLPWVG